MTFDAGRIRHDMSLMHYSRASNGTAIPSNWIPAATGDTGVGWQPQAGGGSVSYGSNTTEVAEILIGGVATSVARSDHYHAGIKDVTSSSSNTLQKGRVNFRSGANVGLTATDTDGDGEFDTITIHSSAAGTGGSSVTDYVSGPTGSGQIIIPGLYGSADIQVAGGSDDEFDTTDTSDPMTGWTTLQTPTTHDINSTVKSHYYVKKTASNASTANVGIYKSWSPSNGSTVTCKVTDCVQSTVNFQRGAMLFVGESTPGKMVCLMIVQDGSGPRPVVVSQSAPCTFSSTLATWGSAGLYMPIYMRIVYNSSTSISYYISGSGKFWTGVLGAANPGFTVGSAGVAIDPANTSTDGEAIFDWVRFT